MTPQNQKPARQQTPQQAQRRYESAVWLRIAVNIEQTGIVPGDNCICHAANITLPFPRSYGVVKACFGGDWPFGTYHDRASACQGNQQRVLAATLLSLIVCTDQEPQGAE